MGCCEATNPELQGPVPDQTWWQWPGSEAILDRRTAVKGILAAGAVALGACSPRSESGGNRVRLAFCGQLLCVIPYEVTRAQGHFADEGFDLELVYTRGGNAAMQALVGGAVEYAGTSFDVALQAAANGASIRRFASPKPLPSSSDWHVKKSERTQGVRTNWSTATRATVAVVVEAWTSVRALCLAGVCSESKPYW